MYFGSKGFTLIEVLISIVIASFIFLSVGTSLFLLTKSLQNLNHIKGNLEFYELIITLQRGLLNAKDLSIEKTAKGTLVGFYSNYAFSSIFARIELFVTDKEVIYKEIIPYGDKVLFKQKFRKKCNLLHKRDFLVFSCNGYNLYFQMQIKRHTNPFF